MQSKKIIIIPMLLALACSASAGEFVIRFLITYDENFTDVELTEVKAIYGHASEEELPGNSEFFLLTETGEELYSMRTAFIAPGVLFGRPFVYPDSNYYDSNIPTDYRHDVEVDEGLKEINIPYHDEASEAKIVFDINKTYSFPIAERLCNYDGVCDPEESSISCPDCDPAEPDGVCIPLKDGVCDPDCAPGVDPDCLELKETPTPTPKPSPTPTPTPITPDADFGNLYLILIGFAACMAVLAFVYFKKIKGD